MKVLLVATLLLLCLTTGAQAQFTVGPKAGLSYSTLHSDAPYLDADEIVSYHAGLFVRIGKRVYLQPEAYFVRKGSDLSIRDLSGEVRSGPVRYHSVDVPLLLGAKLIDLRKVNLRLAAGPMVSLVVDERRRLPELDEANPTLWGYQAGVGLDVLRFTADLRYEAGLNRFNPDLDARPGSVHLTFGWKLF
ncbi:MAG: porin family protein [Catalinimonas sp.]